MTRLTTEWISHIVTGMEEYDRVLKSKTGIGLAELSARCAGMDPVDFAAAAAGRRVACIPITQGEGIIGSFSESVASIVSALGAEAFVTRATDVDGIWEAREAGADVLFFADDTRYLALNVKTGACGENNYATALGYVKVLEALMEFHGLDIRSERILVIGLGLVGRIATEILDEMGVDYIVYDHDSTTLDGYDCYKLQSPEEIREYPYVLDFTNQGGWLGRGDLAREVLYATPGVPYSPDDALAERIEPCAVHDELEIGTAVMLALALA